MADYRAWLSRTGRKGVELPKHLSVRVLGGGAENKVIRIERKPVRVWLLAPIKDCPEWFTPQSVTPRP